MTDYLKASQAAELTGLSVSKLAKDRMQGIGLPYVSVSPRCVRYRRTDIDAYMEARLVNAIDPETASGRRDTHL